MNQLLKMKERKEKGASFIMQDDVARFLGGAKNPDYNHPLFDPTIDFILLLRNAFLAQSQNVEMALEQAGIPTLYDPEYFAQISLGAGLEASRRSPEIPQQIRRQMAEYFEEMEGQQQRFTTVDKLADDLENRIKGSKKDKKQGVSKNFLRSIIDVIVKRNLKNNQPQQSQQQGQGKQTLLGMVQQVAVQLVQAVKPKTQEQKKKKQTNPEQKAQRFNLLRRRNSQQIQQPKQQVQQQVVQNVEVIKKTETKKQTETKTKTAPDKTRQDLISSEQIDKTVKAKAAENKSHVPPEQREKMEAAKQSEVRVTKMDMGDAVKLLQNSGVKTTEATSAKPTIDKSIENTQPQQAQNQQNKPEKQRL